MLILGGNPCWLGKQLLIIKKKRKPLLKEEATLDKKKKKRKPLLKGEATLDKKERFANVRLLNVVTVYQLWILYSTWLVKHLLMHKKKILKKKSFPLNLFFLISVVVTANNSVFFFFFFKHGKLQMNFVSQHVSLKA